jgi:phage terminase large subunit
MVNAAPSPSTSSNFTLGGEGDVEYTKVELEDEALAMSELFERDPEYFYHEVLGVEPWEKQLETVQSIRTNRETCVYSCHASGKSWNASAVVLWFLFSHPGSIVLTTAPTFRQVKDILWREIGAKFEQARYKLGERINKTELNLSNEWFAIGLSTTDPDRFQGYHSSSGDLLVVVDESAGVDELIFEAVRAVMTADACRLLMIGNPTSNSGYFFNSSRAPGVKKIQIKAWDTPNFTHHNFRTPEDLCRIYCPPLGATSAEKEAFVPEMIHLPNPRLISPRWVHECFHKWGERSPMYQSRIEAIFPEQGDKTLIPLAWIEKAMSSARREGDEIPILTAAGKLKLVEGKPATRFVPGVPLGKPAYGVDVARFGADRTVITYRLGDNVQWQKSYSKQKTTDTTSQIQALLKTEADVDVFIDVIGVGAGVYDQLTDIIDAEAYPEDKHRIHAVNVAERPYEDVIAERKKQEPPRRFRNLRAELYWRLKDLFETNQIALPYDEDLANELCQLQFEIKNGIIKIEEKDEMKKRLQMSPDLADSLMLAFAEPGYETWHSDEDNTKRPGDGDMSRSERFARQEAESDPDDDEAEFAGIVDAMDEAF